MSNEHDSAQKTLVIEAELSRLLYTQAPTGFVATLLNASILTGVLWSVMSTMSLLGWYCSMLAITGARFLLMRRHQQVAPPEDREPHWRTLYILGTASVGLAWGTLSLFLFPTELSHQVFVAFVFAGMSAGAVTILASVPLAALSFFLPMLTPLAWQFFRQGNDLGVAMGTMIVIFLATLLFAVRHLHAATVETLELRFSHMDLLDQLTAKTTALHKAHDGLDQQVQERTAELFQSNQKLEAEIVERRRAEEALRRSEEHFRALIENAADIIMILNADGVIRYRSPTASGKGLHGYSTDALVGKSVFELIYPDDRQRMRELFFTQALARRGVMQLSPFRALHSDGSCRIMEGTLHNLLHHPVIAGIIYTGRDITERQEAESALAESEARYRTLIESTHDLIQSVDPEGRFLFVNAAWLQTLGYGLEDLPHLQLFDIIHPDFHPHCQQMFARVLAGEAMRNVQVMFVAKDGTHVPVEGNVTGRRLGGKLVATHGFFRDITERRRVEKEKQTLQEQLAQAQKLQSLGTLAGGIAHDFNNLLTPIIGFSELLKRTIAPGTVAHDNLEEILKASRRARALVQQMLDFSRPSQHHFIPISLKTLVEECLSLLHVGLPPTIEIQTSFDPVAGMVIADPTQLHQVVMNLGINALHAMEGKEGRLAITVQQAVVEEPFAALHPPLTPGRYCRLMVSDTGCGIAPTIQAQIFDPFFTTKEVGKGSGLGLSVVHGIVSNHGGVIVVDSTPGQGSTFTIYFPLLEDGALRSEMEGTVSLSPIMEPAAHH